MKIYKNLFSAGLFLFVVGSSYAQTPDCYYDANWKPTSREYAAYYRVITKLKENYYKIEDFYADGTLQMLGYSNERKCKDGKLINETTWYDKDGLMSSYQKYDENGQVAIETKIEGYNETTIFYKDKIPYKGTKIIKGSPFIVAFDKLKNGRFSVEKLYYFQKLLIDKNYTVNKGGNITSSYVKYYDYYGKLIYQENSEKLDKGKNKRVNYYNAGYIVTTYNEQYPIIQENFDSNNQLIHSIVFKEGSPENGVYSLANVNYSLTTIRYKNGIVTNTTFFLDSEKKLTEVYMQDSGMVLTFYDSIGANIGSVKTDKNKNLDNGTVFYRGKLIEVYKNGEMIEEYTYNKNINSLQDFLNKGKLFSYDYFDTKDCFLIAKRVNNEKTYYDKQGNIISTLLLKKECDNSNQNCNWINYTGKYYPNAEEFNYTDYIEYKEGKLIGKQYSFRFGKVIRLSSIENSTSAQLAQIYKNGKLKETYKEDIVNDKLTVLDRKIYDENGIILDKSNVAYNLPIVEHDYLYDVLVIAEGMEEAPVVAEIVDDTKVYTIVEQMPEFPRGDIEMIKFIDSNIIYPQYAIDNELTGRSIIAFVVYENGELHDITVKRSSGYPELDKEAVRVISSMPKWKPGKQQGRAVRVSYLIPVTFKLKGNEEKK